MNNSYEPETRPRGGLDHLRRRDVGDGWLSQHDLGIAAIDDSAFFTDEGRYVIFDNLSTWGWFLLSSASSSSSPRSRSGPPAFGQVFGIACASLNAVILLFTVNAFPFAAFMLFIVDLLVIHGLAVYGGQRPRQV